MTLDPTPASMRAEELEGRGYHGLEIVGLGTAVPPRVAPQDQAAEVSPLFCGADERQARMLRVLYRKSGVKTRHSVAVRGGPGSLLERVPYFPVPKDEGDLGPTTGQRMTWYEQEAPALAMEAARKALADAGESAADITHLVTVSCTGFFSPGVDAAMIRELGIPRDVHRTHVGFMGCHGALNGLRVAGAYGADPDARVLLVALELCSLHFAYGWDPEMLVANTLFADGAAALVGKGRFGEGGGPRGAAAPDGLAAAGGPGLDIPEAHEGGGWRVVESASFLMPDSEEAMSWRIGDHGFRMTLSPQVPDAIRAHLGDWLTGWLGGHGLGIEDVASWAVHPGGPRILDAVEDVVGLDRGGLEIPREVLETHGNMSSPTVLFILERLRQADAPRPCVALAFGPGLVVEGALIR
jgi:predicted naringenin-chalcone synthase